jgi:hypothetical protein
MNKIKIILFDSNDDGYGEGFKEKNKQLPDHPSCTDDYIMFKDGKIKMQFVWDDRMFEGGTLTAEQTSRIYRAMKEYYEH